MTQRQVPTKARKDDPNRAYRILIADLIGLKFDDNGQPDPSAVKSYIEAQQATFTFGGWSGESLPAGQHFFYLPDLSTPEELSEACCDGQYDAVIAAATFLPTHATFPEGGVRIGAGTGNMACTCWGGADGVGGDAPLMNTPSFNSRATAQMVMKALLGAMPELDVDALHRRVIDGDFDTGKHLRDYPTEKLEGKRFAVLGYGNIGRETAKLAQTFGMSVAIYAREHHQKWIEAEGFVFAKTPVDAARDAHVISAHVGLGALCADGTFANNGLIDASVLNALSDGAIVINYDRGEVVDTTALRDAFSSGKVGFAAVDADLFVADDGALSGPMAPYRPLAQEFPERLQLLPHAAADTDHSSRIEGAKQAVDQILSAIRYRRIINAKGDIPAGYVDGGSCTVAGVGKVSANRIAEAAEDEDTRRQMRKNAELLAAIWAALDTAQTPEERSALIQDKGAALTLASNALRRDLERLGLLGPYG